MNKLRKLTSPNHMGSDSPHKPAYHRADTVPSSTWTDGSQAALGLAARSKTMALAMASSSLATAGSPALPGYMRPCSPAEQYWAARALTAETLLAAKTDHQRDLREVAYSEDVKRVVRRGVRLCGPVRGLTAAPEAGAKLIKGAA
jgi:hypothetical protein